MKYLGESGLLKLLTLIKTKIESLTASDVGAIPTTNGAVGTNNIANSAVTSDKIASTSVGASKLIDGSITSEKLIDGVVIEAKVGDNAITSSKIKDAAITSAKLADSAVISAKIGSSAVTEAKISNGAVSTGKIADGAVTGAKIDSSAVTREKLANDALYSPGNTFSTANYSIVASDGGKTIWATGTAASLDIVITLSQSVSSAMPVNAEIALVWMYGKSFALQSDGVRLAMVGESGFFKTGVKITERFGMISLKKMAPDGTNGDLWLVQGLAEVVS